jgi:hypothetical protein
MRRQDCLSKEQGQKTTMAKRMIVSLGRRWLELLKPKLRSTDICFIVYFDNWCYCVHLKTVA